MLIDLFVYYISLLCLKYVGGSAIGSVFRDTVDKESISVLTSALKNGFNLIDTAPWYGFGKSETVLGKVSWCLVNDYGYYAIEMFSLVYL